MSGHPNQELGIPRTVNTNGLLDRINYQMDGMVDTESDRYGVRLFPIADIYVGEIQTVSNSFLPEFGMTSGDIYNVITPSGAVYPPSHGCERPAYPAWHEAQAGFDAERCGGECGRSNH